MDNQRLCAERARELFSYVPETGTLTRKVYLGVRGPGSYTTKPLAPGRARVVKVDGKSYLAHRVAWLIETGEWPERFLDHKNGRRGDNALINLREASPQLNAENRRKARRGSRTGLLGVSCCGTGYQVRVTLAGTTRHLGTYRTPAEAHQAYLTAKRELHVGCTI